jgi:hypothetical protein
MLAAILLAELTLFVGLTQTGSGDSTRVVGRVMCHSHSQPVPHAMVVASSDSEIAETEADGRGRYAFLTLLPGVYSLTACAATGCAGDVYSLGGVRLADQPLSQSDRSVSFVELSAGVEYLANIAVAAPCR